MRLNSMRAPLPAPCTSSGKAFDKPPAPTVGAGGLSNALPELVHGAGKGARIEFSRIPRADRKMSPREVWSNEAQERYVLAVAPDARALFEAMCARERCPYAVVGV